MDDFADLDFDLFDDDDDELSQPEPVREGPLPVERDAVVELGEVLAGFKGRAGRENQRFADATNSEYWFAVCFQTQEQKDEFLSKMGLEEIGDKYLDGIEVADKLGIKLESRIPPLPRLRSDAKLTRLT